MIHYHVSLCLPHQLLHLFSTHSQHIPCNPSSLFPAYTSDQLLKHGGDRYFPAIFSLQQLLQLLVNELYTHKMRGLDK